MALSIPSHRELRKIIVLNPKGGSGKTTLAINLAGYLASIGRPDTVVIISADAMAAHQAVVNVLDAARRAGLSRLAFAAQTANGAPR